MCNTTATAARGLKSHSDFRSRSLADTREDNIAVVDIAVSRLSPQTLVKERSTHSMDNEDRVENPISHSV